MRHRPVLRCAAAAALTLGAWSCTDLTPYRKGGAHIGSFAPLPAGLGTLDSGAGIVRAVADDGSRRLLLTTEGAVIFRGATSERSASARAWTKAALIPAADGSGIWPVALDEAGHLYRVKAGSDLQDIGNRYGLEGTPIRDVAAAGGRLVAFLLDDAYAVADGVHVTRYAAPGAKQLAAGAARLAVRYGNRIDVVESLGPSVAATPPSPTVKTFLVDAPTSVAVTARGDMYVATDSALYREARKPRPAGLNLIYLTHGRGRLGPLVAAGFRVWFADGNTWGTVEADRVLLAETSAGRPIDARWMAGASDGRLWILQDGKAVLFAARQDASVENTWATTIGPTFSRACSECHLPGGRGDLDLSTGSAWAEHRDAIAARVLQKHTMPPAGRALSEDDTAAIRAFVAAPAP